MTSKALLFTAIEGLSADASGLGPRAIGTRDHEMIRRWAARHHAEPATGEATASGPATVDLNDGGAGIRFKMVDGFQPGLQRLTHGLAIDDTGCQALDRGTVEREDRTPAIERPAQRVDHATEERLFHRYREEATRPSHDVVLFDASSFAQRRRRPTPLRD
jgi:hypothetical protein